MIFFEGLLYLCVVTFTVVGYRSVMRDRFDGYALTLYFIILLYFGRHFMLLTGLDETFPEYLYVFDVPTYRLMALMLIGLWMFVSIMVLRGAGKGPAFIQGVLPSEPSPANSEILVAACLALFVASLGVMAYPIRLYGLDLNAISYSVRVEQLFAGFSFVQLLGSIGGYLSISTMFYHILQSRRNTVPSSKIYVIGMFLMGFTGTASTLLMGERDQFAFWAVFVAMSFSLYVKRISTVSFGIFGALIMGFMMLAGWYRLYVWGYEKDPQTIFRQIATGLNLDVYDKFILLLNTWQREPFRLGEDYTVGLLAIIPRSMWPDKPIDIHPGNWFRHYFEPEIPGGWPFTPVGEWYVNFGWLGVIIGAWLSALILKAVVAKYPNYATNPFAFMFLYLFVTRIFLLGYNTISVMTMVLWIIPLATIFIVARRYDAYKSHQQ